MSDFMEAAMPIMQYFYQRCPCCHALAYAQTELISCPICAVRGRGLTPEMQSINHLQFAEEAQATIARQSADIQAKDKALRLAVEAMAMFVPRCHDCNGTGFHLISYDDPELGGMRCLDCTHIRAALAACREAMGEGTK